MAQASNLSGVKSDPGTEVNATASGVAPAKSFVVGKYDEYGRRKTGGEVVGGLTEASRLSKLLLNSMRNRGGELLPGFEMGPDGPVKITKTIMVRQATPMSKPVIVTKTKGKRNGKVKEAEVPDSFKQAMAEIEASSIVPMEQVFVEAPRLKAQTFPVVFNIDSGTIRSNTDAVLENELAITLVYRDMDQISYIPGKGSRLILTLPDKRKIPVMYLGVQFQWYNSDQQLLVFIKNNIEDEE